MLIKQDLSIQGIQSQTGLKKSALCATEKAKLNALNAMEPDTKASVRFATEPESFLTAASVLNAAEQVLKNAHCAAEKDILCAAPAKGKD